MQSTVNYRIKKGESINEQKKLSHVDIVFDKLDSVKNTHIRSTFNTSETKTINCKIKKNKSPKVQQD